MASSMDAEVKTKWLEALRSGRYVQAEGRLRKGADGYCCLGVLCDLHSTAVWSVHRNTFLGRDEWVWHYDSLDLSENMPPKAFMRSVGLKFEDAQLLAKRNDNGFSFKEIADWIEKNA